MNPLQRRKTPLRPIITLTAIGTFLGIGVFLIISHKHIPKPWELDNPPNLDTDFTLSKTGTITENPDIIIYADINGKITSILSETGEEVRGGQPIINLSDENQHYSQQLELIQQQIQSTQELYDNAHENYDQQHTKYSLQKERLQGQIHSLEQTLSRYLTNNQQPEPVLEPEDQTLANPTPIDHEQQRQQQIQQRELQIYQTERELEETKLTLKVLENNYTTQREYLKSSLQSLRNQYEHSYNQYNKLSVRTPVAGNIQEIFVEVGESAYPGQPLFTIQKPTETSQIQVQLTLEEYLTVFSLQHVQIETQNALGERTTYLGEIVLRSPIANEQGMYTISIESDQKLHSAFPDVNIHFS